MRLKYKKGIDSYWHSISRS